MTWTRERDRAYELKKPVDLGFLDCTTIECRRRFWDEEVRLNCRLAPSAYFAVRPVTVNEAARFALPQTRPRRGAFRVHETPFDLLAAGQELHDVEAGDDAPEQLVLH